MSTESYYTDAALEKQAEVERKHKTGEPITTSDMRGIFQPRHRHYGFCPTQLEGRATNRQPFYFRSRGGDWDLHVGPANAPTDYLAWADDTQYTISGDGDIEDADEVDALVTKHLGEGWTPA